jgi:hypothetical protein
MSDDRLAELRRTIAAQHLGNPELGEQLHGGNARQLRDDAERLRQAMGFPDRDRPSLHAALFAHRQKQQRLAARLGLFKR